jgi:L-threonylcarbamoyladenylate synthase
MTEILSAASPKAIKLARRLLREGEVVAFPTDTVYGLGANVFERFAIHQIFAVKERPPDKALPVFIYQLDDLNLVARRVPNQAWALLHQFWPGDWSYLRILSCPMRLPADKTRWPYEFQTTLSAWNW